MPICLNTYLVYYILYGSKAVW